MLTIVYLVICLIDKNTNPEYFKNIKTEKEQIDLTIKQIKPKIINPEASIMFIYLYTENIYDYCQHSIKNLTAYIKKYNYGLTIYSEPFNTSVSPCWNKIPAILENLKLYSYVVWFDADAIVNNFNIPINSILNQYPEAEIIGCLDIYAKKECMNSGIMIIKNTPWAYNIFKKTWESELPHGHNDQNVIFYTIVEDLIPGANQKLKSNPYCLKLSDKKFKLLNENTFNSNIQSYKPGDFILHLMGMSTESRIDVMRQINTFLGLDNYDKKTCINIINNYFKSDRVEKIRKNCW